MKRFLSLLLSAVLCGAFFCFSASAEEAVKEYKENSWRYIDGVQIIDPYAVAPMSETTHPEGTLKAIDVSHAQVVDWEKAWATGMFDFVMIRCGYAEDNPEYDDTQWEYNTSECERLGIPYGVYLYSYAENETDALSEAEHVLRLIEGKSPSFPVYYDLEDKKTEGNDCAAIATAFCERIEQAGYPVGVYASLYWWNTYLTDDCFDNWYRWVAQWNENCEYDGRYEMWQFTNLGYIDGIEKYDTDLKQMVQASVDMNWLIGYPDDHGAPEGPATTGKIRSDDTQYNGKPRITWTKDADAVEYKVYRSQSENGSYKLVKTTTATSFTNTSTTAGNTYYYKVKAVYRNNRTSDYGNTVSLTVPLSAPVTKLYNVSDTGKPKLSWDAVEGADGYEVWRKTGANGKYVRLKTITGTVFSNPSAEVGKTYYYKVKAIRSDCADAASPFSGEKYITCDLARPVLTVTNVASTGKPRLTWTAVEGAQGYEIWRSSTKNGEYSLLAATEKTSATNTKALTGESWYYKVKAIHTNKLADSAFSTAAGRTVDLPRVTGLAVTNVESTGKPKLTWNAVEGAVKYYIYGSSTKDGTYKYLGTASGTTATHSKAAAGETWYYKVKAVHTNSSANSALSGYVARRCDLARPTVKISLNPNGKPKLTWNAVEGAGKYYIYSSSTKDGTYKYLGVASGTTATHTKAVTGETYYYKVKAIHTNSSANSAYSTAVSVTAK